MSKSFLGSKAQACALPLGSSIRATQAFGRKWTHCNLGCGRPFGRKSSRLETDDVQILCLICLDFHRFRKIASVPQPIVCTEPISLAVCLCKSHLRQSGIGLTILNLHNIRISGWCRSYACALCLVSFEFESDSFQPVVSTGT